jgi:Fusaric acid resistance protein-like
MTSGGPDPANSAPRTPGAAGGEPGLTPVAPSAPPVAWSWEAALRCGLCTVPAALVVLGGDPATGLAWAVGILPAAIVGLAPTRRARLRLVVVGALFALSILIGSLLVQTEVTTVVGIFLVAYGSAILASRRAVGFAAMTLCAPVAAIGLSYGDIASAAGLGLIVFAGSVFSCAVFMLWPERSVQAHAPPVLLPAARARQYGLSMGLAAATAAGIGLAINTDHVGWAPAAALLVIRPSEDMQKVRSVGRVVSVVLGALGAVAFLRASPALGWYAVVAVAALAGAGGTSGSRWYVTATFTTFLVLLMLLYADPTVANEQWRVAERVGETALGVGLAYLFGLLVPHAVHRLRKG